MSELADGWVHAAVSDIVDILDSARVPVNRTERALRPGEVPYYGATGQVGWIDRPLFNEELCLLGEDGAPFLDRTKPHAYVVDGPSWVNNHVHVLRAVAGITSNRYLKYVLDWTDYAPYVNGTTRLKLTKTAMCGIPIPLPPLAEQGRIVEALEEHASCLDAAVEMLRRARARLAVLRGQAIATASVGGWPWTTLGEIAEIVGGVTKDSKRQNDPAFIEVPYLRVANVQRGYLDLSVVATIRVPPEKAAALELKPGDVLFNEGGDRDKLGRGWIWSGEVPSCIHQNHVFRARLTQGFDPRFVSWHGNTFGQEWFDANGKQTTNLASISLRTLRQFPVPAPPLDEQRRVVADIEQRLSLIDSLFTAVDATLTRSDSLRRSILERAFTGKLVPQDPSDEPASVLLGRIAVERPASSRRKRSRQTRVSA